MSMMDLINDVRARHGLPPYRPDARLAQAAEGHAADLSRNGYLIDSGQYHFGSDGSTVGQRIARAGYAAERFGEVTGWYTGASREWAERWMVDWWLNSPPHRPYLLATDMAEIGVGYAPDGSWQHVWVVNFARRLGEPEPPDEQLGEHVVYAPVVVGGGGSAAVDLLDYLRGDGRSYRVGNASGSFEVFQTQTEGDRFYQIKAWDDLSVVHWEGFRVDDQFIRRDVDTSPGGGRFYRQFDAPWVRRSMRPGDSFSQSKRLQFFRLSDCQPLEQHSGHVTDTIRFVARYERYTFPSRDWSAVTLNDVIELEWVEGGEVYHFARRYGLVGWSRRHQDPHSPAWSAISEMRPEVGRLERLRVGCL